jgi:hypothetical protein
MLFSRPITRNKVSLIFPQNLLFASVFLPSFLILTLSLSVSLQLQIVNTMERGRYWKAVVSQLIKKFPTSYDTRMFIAEVHRSACTIAPCLESR